MAQADLLACVLPPDDEVFAGLREGSVVVGQLRPYGASERVAAITARKLTAFSLELLPRTTRAQAMDVLSSQAAVAGYRAMLIAAEVSPKFFPMLTTAAGTIRPSKVLVIGAGVAGLQAIATARRLGAQIEGYDVRPETREQVGIVPCSRTSSRTWSRSSRHSSTGPAARAPRPRGPRGRRPPTPSPGSG